MMPTPDEVLSPKPCPLCGGQILAINLDGTVATRRVYVVGLADVGKGQRVGGPNMLLGLAMCRQCGLMVEFNLTALGKDPETKQ